MNAPDSNHDFINRFRECCDQLGSVAKLAERIGVHKNTLRKYGQGTEPPRHNLVKIADACGVSVEWLATGREPRRSGSDAEGRDVPDDSADWVVAHEFMGCDVGGGGAISIRRGRPAVAIPRWAAERAYTGARADWFGRLVSFEVRDNLMSPDLLLNELAVCQVEPSIHPTQLNGIFAFVEEGEVFARYSHRISETELVLSHWKIDFLGARRINVNDLGTRIVLLGRVLLAGAWVGLRHLTPPIQLAGIKAGPNLTLVVDVARPQIESAKLEVEKLGGRVVRLNENDDFVLVTIDQHNAAKLPLIPGVIRMSTFQRAI